MAQAGYSGTPLIKKLGIKAGMAIAVEGAPPHYAELLGPLPDEVREAGPGETGIDFQHLFVLELEALATRLPALKARMAPAGMIWISWPKKRSRLSRGLSEDHIRAAALEAGLVDVKVCAVDEDWSGLKLMIRLKDRPKG